MTEADLPMVNCWLDTPDVARWWIEADGSPSDSFDAAHLAEDDTRPWIVSLGDTPFAFLQDYDPHAHPGHHFAHLPPGSRGIDQFIGVPGMLGRGHGSGFIRQHVEGLLDRGAPVVGTDPHPGNARAIRAYEKAGFTAIGERDTDWGRALLMERRAA